MNNNLANSYKYYLLGNCRNFQRFFVQNSIGKNLEISQTPSGGLNNYFKVYNVKTVILGVKKWGIGQKMFILAQILRFLWFKTSKIHILTFLTIKPIIFWLRSKFLDLPLCFHHQGYLWGRKHRCRSKNVDPSSNIMDFMVKRVKIWILDVLGHASLKVELG